MQVVESGPTQGQDVTGSKSSLRWAVIGIALGHVLYYMSIARLGVAVSAGILQLHPFIVAIASFFLFAEVLTTAQWISGSVAISGAVLMLTAQRRLARSIRPVIEEHAEG